MEPLNKVERREARRNFYLVNGLLIVLFVVGGYMLFASPIRILSHDLGAFQEDEEQQRDLNQKVKDIHSDIGSLMQNDQDRQTTPATDIEGQATLGLKRSNLEDNIRGIQQNIASDTAKALRPIVLTNYQNYFQLLDVILKYRKTIDYLQGAVNDANAKSTVADDANRKLTDDNNQLKTANMIASATKGAGGGGGGGGGADPNAAKMLADKDAQIKDLTDKYNACNTALNQYRTYRGVPSTATQSSPATGGGSGAGILFEEANDLLQKGMAESSPSNRDHYYFVCKDILTKIKGSYPDQTAWKNKYNELQSAMRKAGGY